MSHNPTPSDRRRGSRKSSKSTPNPKLKTPSKAATTPRAPSNNTDTQEILDLFHRTFRALFTPRLPELLQRVKTHLFNRDYLAAFGTQENLEAYVVRWSPSRALCYREVFLELVPEIKSVFELGDGKTEIVCIGGGAGAEVVAAAAAVRALLKPGELAPASVTIEEDRAGVKGEESCEINGELKEIVGTEDTTGAEQAAVDPNPTPLETDLQSLTLTSDTPISPPPTTTTSLHMTAIDIADWTPITNTLTTALTSPTATLPAFVPSSHYSVTFHHHDILSPSPSNTTLIPPSTRLITLLFTTNELYTQSRASTTKFLLSLADLVQAGCLLLVLESAGSYSTVTVNGKVFPMGMLLDHTLMTGERWEKLRGEDSRWFRRQGGRYPVELEDMRYMVRVYRRV